MNNVGLKICILGTSNSMVTLTFFPWCKPKWSQHKFNSQSQILHGLGTTSGSMVYTIPKNTWVTQWISSRTHILASSMGAQCQNFTNNSRFNQLDMNTIELFSEPKNIQHIMCQPTWPCCKEREKGKRKLNVKYSDVNLSPLALPCLRILLMKGGVYCLPNML